MLEAAWTVHDVVNETMAGAVRMHVTERGGNPRQATLVAFGGAGPLHACHLAAKLRVGRVMVPLRAGVLSALGLLIAPPAYDIVRTHKIPLEELDAASTGALIEEMAESIASLLTGLDSEGELRFARGVDVGYIGQSYQVTVPLDGVVERDAIWKRFATLYREKYGYFYDDVPAEIVNLRVLGELVGGELGLEPLPVEPGAAAVAAGTVEPFRVAFAPHRVLSEHQYAKAEIHRLSGSSAAGSRCARLPPIVPRWRVCTCPTWCNASASRGQHAATSPESFMSLWRVMAPIASASPSAAIPASSCTRFRSTTFAGVT